MENIMNNEKGEINKAYFAVNVVDDGMSGASIPKGAVVIARWQAIAEPGDIVVALVNDQAILRRFSKKGNDVILTATNPAFPPIIEESENIIILGKAMQVYVDLANEEEGA